MTRVGADASQEPENKKSTTMRWKRPNSPSGATVQHQEATRCCRENTHDEGSICTSCERFNSIWDGAMPTFSPAPLEPAIRKYRYDRGGVWTFGIPPQPKTSILESFETQPKIHGHSLETLHPYRVALVEDRPVGVAIHVLHTGCSRFPATCHVLLSKQRQTTQRLHILRDNHYRRRSLWCNGLFESIIWILALDTLFRAMSIWSRGAYTNESTVFTTFFS